MPPRREEDAPIAALWPMLEVPAGEFWMGGKQRNNEKPRHRVRLPAFSIGTCPVTNADWERVMAQEKGEARKPVVRVSWEDALEFCNRASELVGLHPCYQNGKWDRAANGFRLPTEAEWEYACRAGTDTDYFWGEGDPTQFAWFGEPWCAGGEHPVGEKQPNPWGLHDMAGNVWEWCWDAFQADAYRRRVEAGVVDNPVVEVDKAPGRVVRGGSFIGDMQWLRSAYRDRFRSVEQNVVLGFRCARSAPR